MWEASPASAHPGQAWLASRGVGGGGGFAGRLGDASAGTDAEEEEEASCGMPSSVSDQDRNSGSSGSSSGSPLPQYRREELLASGGSSTGISGQQAATAGSYPRTLLTRVATLHSGMALLQPQLQPDGAGESGAGAAAGRGGSPGAGRKASGAVLFSRSLHAHATAQRHTTQQDGAATAAAPLQRTRSVPSAAAHSSAAASASACSVGVDGYSHQLKQQQGGLFPPPPHPTHPPGPNQRQQATRREGMGSEPGRSESFQSAGWGRGEGRSHLDGDPHTRAALLAEPAMPPLSRRTGAAACDGVESGSDVGASGDLDQEVRGEEGGGEVGFDVGSTARAHVKQGLGQGSVPVQQQQQRQQRRQQAVGGLGGNTAHFQWQQHQQQQQRPHPSQQARARTGLFSPLGAGAPPAGFVARDTALHSVDTGGPAAAEQLPASGQQSFRNHKPGLGLGGQPYSELVGGRVEGHPAGMAGWGGSKTGLAEQQQQQRRRGDGFRSPDQQRGWPVGVKVGEVGGGGGGTGEGGQEGGASGLGGVGGMWGRAGSAPVGAGGGGAGGVTGGGVEGGYEGVASQELFRAIKAQLASLQAHLITPDHAG